MSDTQVVGVAASHLQHITAEQMIEKAGRLMPGRAMDAIQATNLLKDILNDGADLPCCEPKLLRLIVDFAYARGEDDFAYYVDMESGLIG